MNDQLGVLSGSLPTGPIAYGTRGTLVVRARPSAGHGPPTPVIEVYTSRGHGLGGPDRVVEGKPLPEGRTTLAEEFVHMKLAEIGYKASTSILQAQDEMIGTVLDIIV